MSKQTERDRFTKVTSDLLLGMREMVNWGLDTGNTTPEMLRLTIAARKETAVKLIESGMSQRQAAKLLGVHHSTVGADLAENPPDAGGKSQDNSKGRGGKSATGSKAAKTGSAATKAHRAKTAATARAGGVTEAPADKYRIVYADPPWDYGAHAQPDYQTEQRDHYPVMELQAICDVPVEEWVEDDAVLFLWATSPILEKSFEVVHAWGFEYKTTFVWDKIKHNMGHYNSVRHEFLLVCTRGACQPDTKQLFDSVQSIERSKKHSQKPAEFYDIIETLYTHGRRLEIFARAERDGWDVYGHLAELRKQPEEPVKIAEPSKQRVPYIDDDQPVDRIAQRHQQWRGTRALDADIAKGSNVPK